MPRLATLQVMAGGAILLGTLIAQFSSLPTLYLARQPGALVLLGSGGILLLGLAALACVVMAARTHSARWITAAALYLALAGIVRTSPLLVAFQLLCAGLTVGGGLVLLGCLRFTPSLKLTRRP